MSQKNQGNSHNLLYQDYQFPLEDRKFLDDVAYHIYSVPAKRLTDAIRETLRILTNFKVKIQYALHVTDSSPQTDAWRVVNEHIALIGQHDLPFVTIEIANGPLMVQDKAIYLSPLELAKSFDAMLLEMSGSFTEWWLEGTQTFEQDKSKQLFNKYTVANTFQVATLGYELRRILLDTSTAWEGRCYKDAHGKLQLMLTQKGPMQFDDERVVVKVSIIPPAVFNAAVVEVTEREKQKAQQPA
jgi:hypothetical protein